MEGSDKMTLVGTWHPARGNTPQVNGPVICLGPASCPLLKAGITFAFLQASGTYPDCHDLSKMIESGLTMMSTSSLNRIPSGATDFWMSSLTPWSLTQSSSTMEKSFLQQRSHYQGHNQGHRNWGVKNVGFLLSGERYHWWKILFSESDNTSKSSGVCQVQKLKHWDRGGRQCKMCLCVWTALSEEGI